MDGDSWERIDDRSPHVSYQKIPSNFDKPIAWGYTRHMEKLPGPPCTGVFEVLLLEGEAGLGRRLPKAMFMFYLYTSFAV